MLAGYPQESPWAAATRGLCSRPPTYQILAEIESPPSGIDQTRGYNRQAMSHETTSSGDAAAEKLRADEQDHALHRHPGELITVWVLWLVYGAFYFCRTNMSAVMPGIKKSVADGGLGLSDKEVGYIQGVYKFSYAIGQLLNGQFSEYLSPRKLLAIGMFGSAALNITFGAGFSYAGLILLWAANGYCQSLGWTPCMRVVGNWIPIERRGKAIGIIGTGYQVTQGITFIVATEAASRWGWRGALYVPAGMLIATGIFMLLFLKEQPADAECGGSRSNNLPKKSDRPLMETLMLTLSNPALWILGISLGLLNACRYGFVDWGITHLLEVQKTEINAAGIKYGVLAIGAAAGSYLTGTITDRFFKGRRAPAVCSLLVLLSVLTLLYEQAAQTSTTVTIGLLLLIGFCIYGPQVLLVGTAPSDMAKQGTGAAAAGFVNFLGYTGAGIGDIVTGHYKTLYGWQTTIYIWAGWALAAAVFAALLWNAKPRKDHKTAA
jgi:MFS transporter, OPA family, glycerol-3-phosphate transporter